MKTELNNDQFDITGLVSVIEETGLEISVKGWYEEGKIESEGNINGWIREFKIWKKLGENKCILEKGEYIVELSIEQFGRRNRKIFKLSPEFRIEIIEESLRKKVVDNPYQFEEDTKLKDLIRTIIY